MSMRIFVAIVLAFISTAALADSTGEQMHGGRAPDATDVINGLYAFSSFQQGLLESTDLKGNEEAIVQWCEQLGVPLRLIPRSLIQERPWVTERSPLVYSQFGIEGVCEPCALLATLKGRLILPKFTRSGVAVAIAEEVSGI